MGRKTNAEILEEQRLALVDRIARLTGDEARLALTVLVDAVNNRVRTVDDALAVVTRITVLAKTQYAPEGSEDLQRLHRRLRPTDAP